jgi:hypothetical protein
MKKKEIMEFKILKINKCNDLFFSSLLFLIIEKLHHHKAMGVSSNSQWHRQHNELTPTTTT